MPKLPAILPAIGVPKDTHYTHNGIRHYQKGNDAGIEAQTSLLAATFHRAFHIGLAHRALGIYWRCQHNSKKQEKGKNKRFRFHGRLIFIGAKIGRNAEDC